MRHCGARFGLAVWRRRRDSWWRSLFALFYGRAIAQPLVALSGMAAALGRGEHIPAQHLNLKEAQATADQMHIAGAALEQRAREVDRSECDSQPACGRAGGGEQGTGGLSYSVSHVLRAPLRAIDGFSQILLDEHSATLDSEGKRLIGVLRSNARALNEQIDGILEFLRLNRDKMSRRQYRDGRGRPDGAEEA